jgi:MFS family permease
MPLRWKIFFALNFVLSLPALVFLIYLFLELINSYNRYTDYFIGLLFLFSLLLIVVNGFLNIYLLQRFFPDKLVPEPIKKITLISLVLNILVAIGILIFCIYIGSLLLSYRAYGAGNNGARFTLAIIFLLWIVQVIVLIMQGQLPALINRNNRDKINSLIDSIGE